MEQRGDVAVSRDELSHGIVLDASIGLHGNFLLAWA
jgi:hypothetical protein